MSVYIGITTLKISFPINLVDVPSKRTLLQFFSPSYIDIFITKLKLACISL